MAAESSGLEILSRQLTHFIIVTLALRQTDGGCIRFFDLDGRLMHRFKARLLFRRFAASQSKHSPAAF